MEDWFLIEYAGEQYETPLNAKTAEQAVEKAIAIWSKLSAYDRKRRKEFYIVQTKSKDGVPDFNKITQSIDLLH